jgi:hypothetical protein
MRHDVQTFTRFGDPFTIARTRWMFGFQRRFVRRCEWLSFMPKIGFLPHTSHTDDIETHLEKSTTGLRTPTAEHRRKIRKNRMRLAPMPAGSSSAAPARN